jgi:hypothetical protein
MAAQHLPAERCGVSDIANELRERSLRAEQEGEPLALLDEAADEIERLRNLRDEDGVVMSKLIDGYQKILRLLIDGPESMETDIVSDAREWLDRYAGRVSTHSAKCHGWHDACLIARLVSEIERLRVNAAE